MFSKIFRSRSRTMNHHDIVGALDIGTGTIGCLIARLDQENGIEILGIGQSASRGFQQGIITEMEELLHSINQAVQMAEETAQIELQSVYVSLAPTICRSHQLDLELPIEGHEVDMEDIRRLIQQACQYSYDRGREVIHTIPLRYTIDGTHGIRDPRGMFGEKMTARIHVIDAPASHLKNLMACIERAHLSVTGFIASSYAAGLAVLEPDEMELGTIVLDVGAGTTGVSVFSQGKIRYLDGIKVGGLHLTNDLARGVSTTLSHAERIKILYGSVISTSINDRENIIIPRVGEKKGTSANRVQKTRLIEILRPRVEELYEIVQKKLRTLDERSFSGYRVVVTGGTSQLSGIKELGSVLMSRPVRLGYPIHFSSSHEGNESPVYSVASGMLAYAHMHMFDRDDVTRRRSFFPNPIASIRLWIRENL